MTQVPVTLDAASGDLRQMTVVELAAIGGSGVVPIVVADGATFTVAGGSVLFRSEIQVLGELIIKPDGELCQV